ncbi:MAG TPA: glycosyltransferase family 4 protein [Burkholderiaceae bacterium]|nr:glycosyltransferase family 4 protein [Burkholderiaceae bacterium]
MKEPEPSHLVIVVHSLRAGGAERVAADLARWWVESGRQATVITQTAASSDVYVLHDKVARIALHTAKNTTGPVTAVLSNIRRLERLRRTLRRVRPTVVLGIMPTTSMLAIVASLGQRYPIVASEHTHPPAQPLPPFWQRLRRWAYPRAKTVVALTDETAAWLRKEIPDATLAVIPNAVQWPVPASRSDVLLPPENGRQMLLAVGRLHYIKGFDRLITAFASLTDRFPGWDLVILGEGAERSTLEAQISQTGLTNRVALPGRVGNVTDWYEAADIYVLSSRAEGLSNTLLEAMASGRAVVAVDCDTGPREIISHGVDGLLVQPADDPDALARQLAALMADAAWRKELGQQARMVRERYAPETIMRLWDELLA